MAPLRPVSAEQAHELADSLVTAAYAGNVRRISRLFDLRTTVQRALSTVPGHRWVDEGVLDTVTAAVRRRFEKVGLAHSLAQVAQDRSELRLLRETHAGEGRWLALRRNSARGIEHIDCLLSVNDKGDVVIVDTWLLSTGERMSDELRRFGLTVALGELSAIDLDVPSGLTAAEEKRLAEHASLIRGAQEANAVGRYADALGLWAKLPEAVRMLPHALFFEFELALQTNEPARYDSVFKTIEGRYPDAPATPTTRLNYHLAKEQYAQALEAVDGVARTAISDPYFDVVRSNILTDMHEPAAAKEAALRALSVAPDLKDAYWNLVAVSLNEGDYAATADLLLEMRQKFSLEYSLEKAPVFAKFVASPHYARFLQGLKAGAGQGGHAQRGGRRATTLRNPELPSPPSTARIQAATNRGTASTKQGPQTRPATAHSELRPRDVTLRTGSSGTSTRGRGVAVRGGGDAPGVVRSTDPGAGQVTYGQPYVDMVQRMATARATGFARAQRMTEAEKTQPVTPKEANGDYVGYQVANTVMNIAVGTDY